MGSNIKDHYYRGGLSLGSGYYLNGTYFSTKTAAEVYMREEGFTRTDARKYLQLLYDEAFEWPHE